MQQIIQNLKKCRRHLTIFLAFSIAALYSFNFSAANSKDVKLFVNEVSTKVITLMKENISDEEKEKKLTSVFKQVIDTDWIGKFAIGKHWRSATPEQQKEYLELFSKYLLDMYVPNFKKYTNQQVKINNVTETTTNEYLVQTEMIDPTSKNSIRIDYRITKKSTNYKDYVIFDIIAEGVSLISTQRAEFSSIIAKSGFNALLATLKKKEY